VAHRREVVLVVMTGLDGYQTSLLAAIQAELSDRGVSVLAQVQDEHDRNPAASLRRLFDLVRPVGVISTNSLDAERERDLLGLVHERGIPAVHIGQVIPNGVCVRGDSEPAMRAVMEHLLDDCGVRRPALVLGLQHQPDHATRERVFREELARRSLPVHEDLLVTGHCRQELAYREVSDLIRRGADFDAVLTMEDWSAVAVMEALRAHGVQVPRDVRVTGFDNTPIASTTWPQLTSVDQALDEQGRTAARLLLQGEGVEQRTYLVPCRLIVRGSTAQIPATEQPAVAVAAAVATAEAGQAGFSAQNTIVRLNRALIQCATLDDIAAVIAEHANSLGLTRCFIVLQPEDNAHGTDREYRLLLDYRDGTAHLAQLGRFTGTTLLPSGLTSEAAGSALVFQPLSVPGRRLGYMLFEQRGGSVPLAEVFRLDVSRTMASLVSVAEMEALVASRTTELRLEVANRRRTELALQEAVGKLSESLLLDGLTGIANRVAFEQQMNRLSQGQCTADVSLLMVDVDEFKAFNDALGHLMGDEALRVVAGCLSRSIHRPGDLACRYGGEEFAIILPGADLKSAVVVAERFRQLLAESAVPHPASGVSTLLTASIGIASIGAGHSRSSEALVHAADLALYRAKDLGRNTYAVADSNSAQAVSPTADPAIPDL
jgi:diguanylate cyclase (GGDEF)-like protein